MILGIIAVPLSFVVIGFILGIIGFFLSMAGAMGSRNKKGIPITGMILSLLSILIVVIIVLFFRPPSNNKAERKENGAQKSDSVDDGIIDIDIDKCHVKYIKHELTEKRNGDKCIAVYYEFTNNSDSGKTFIYTISDKAFQNGVELDNYLFHINEESKNADAEIKPGVTITVCSTFVLRDDTSDVELEIGKWITRKENPADTMTLSLQ